MPKWCAEGLTSVGKAYLKGLSLPTLYLGLYENATEPATDDSMTDITEAATPGENGYSRIALDPGDWTESPAGAWTHAAQSFLASGGDWGLIRGFFVTTAETGMAGDLVCVKHFPAGPYQMSAGSILAFVPTVTNVTEFSPSQAYIGTLAVVFLPGADYAFVQPGDTDWFLVDRADRLAIDSWAAAGAWYNAANPAQHWAGTKGIPTFPVGVTLTILDVDITGVVDATATINAALAACPAYHAVLLPYTGPTGGIRIDGSLYFGSWLNPSVPNGVVLRGSGPGQTRLLKYGSGHCIYIAGGQGPAGAGSVPWVNITAGAVKGSTSITVSDATNILVGDVIRIDQLNDQPMPTGGDLRLYGDPWTPGPTAHWASEVSLYEVMTQSPDGAIRGWCGRSWPDQTGTRYAGELRFVTAKVGNTLTLHRGLNWTYSPANVPQAGSVIRTPRYLCGAEQLSIVSQSTNTSGDLANLDFTAYCFFRNVETSGCADRHIRFANFNIGGEIRRCYGHGAKYYDAGRGYTYSGMVGTDDTLIEDNIVNDSHAPIQFAGGDCGNVVGYNYTRYSRLEPGNTWFVAHAGTHAPHTWFCLWEGNIVGQMMWDGYHGTGSRHTALRNWCLGRNEGDDYPQVYQYYHAFSVEAGNKYCSAIGNVLGFPGYLGAYEPEPYASENTVYPGAIWKVGYAGLYSEALNFTVGTPIDTLAHSSMLRHGNYDYADAETKWDGGIGGRDIPSSLYLSEKPSWFGSLAWPNIGPDISGLNNDNPAKRRWDNYVISGVLADLFADMS